MIISSASFVGSISLPLGANTDINAYITKYEPEIIRMLLGLELGQVVIDDDGNGATQRVADLLDGKQYTSSGVYKKWLGLKAVIIPQYVYCKYLMNKDSFMMPTGVVVPQNENAQVITNHGKIVATWQELYKYYMPTTTDYYNVTSAYDFLIDNESDYSEWEFTELKQMTGLSI